MGNKQKQINADNDSIVYYESQLLETHKEVVMTDEEFAALPPELQIETPVVYAG